jgi:hypothetical protein
MLIEHGANKDALNAWHYTPLFRASFNRHVAVVEYLLEQGCDIDHVDNYGQTALHGAWLGLGSSLRG